LLVSGRAPRGRHGRPDDPRERAAVRSAREHRKPGPGWGVGSVLRVVMPSASMKLRKTARQIRPRDDVARDPGLLAHCALAKYLPPGCLAAPGLGGDDECRQLPVAR